MNNCTISDNSASYFGGGVRLDGGNAALKNCLITRNISTNSRAGGVLLGGGCAVNNCTVVSNWAKTAGGGIYFGSSAGSGTANNCIVWGNIGSPSSNNDIGVNSGFIADINYSCVNSTQFIGLGQGNIYANPLFVDTNTANYRLAANSPCINTGTNESWMTGAFDLDGRTRIRYGIVDIGAYETIYDGTIYRMGF